MGQDVALARHRQLERADHARGLPGSTVLVVEPHAVDVEGRLVVVDEDTLVEPLVEEVAHVVVAIPPSLGLGEVDPHHVPRAASLEARPLVGTDDVVGRRDDVVEVDPRRGRNGRR